MWRDILRSDDIDVMRNGSGASRGMIGRERGIERIERDIGYRDIGEGYRDREG